MLPYFKFLNIGTMTCRNTLPQNSNTNLSMSLYHFVMTFCSLKFIKSTTRKKAYKKIKKDSRMGTYSLLCLQTNLNCNFSVVLIFCFWNSGKVDTYLSNNGYIILNTSILETVWMTDLHQTFWTCSFAVNFFTT